MSAKPLLLRGPALSGSEVDTVEFRRALVVLGLGNDWRRLSLCASEFPNLEGREVNRATLVQRLKAFGLLVHRLAIEDLVS